MLRKAVPVQGQSVTCITSPHTHVPIVNGYKSNALKQVRLPSRLANRDNIEVLTGGSRYLGFDVHAGIEFALATYAKHHDLVSLANASIEGYRSPHLCIDVRSSGAEVRFKQRDDTGGEELLCGPQVSIKTHHADRPCEGVRFSLYAALWNAPDIRGTYSVYYHTFAHPTARYIGITRRGWRARWQEHVRAASTGSNYAFHAALRSLVDVEEAAHVTVACGLDFETAMDLEEVFVGEWALSPRGLNMIPGGFAGAAFLKQLRPSISAYDVEHRERMLADMPAAALLWQDAAYAEKVICGNYKNFCADEVRSIRRMAGEGVPVEDIARVFSCRPIRVALLINGHTYKRVK